MKKAQIDNLITHLVAIKEFSKDIHYTCHGEAFYAKHLLVDKFEWDANIDLLKECVILGNNEKPESSKYYLSNTIGLLIEPKLIEDRPNFIFLSGLIDRTLDVIKELEDLSKADENVVGGIAQDLQQYKGLINLQIEE